MADDRVIRRDALTCREGQLALDLSAEAVRLLARSAEGGWTELGSAPLDGDFRSGIEALRRDAEARGTPRVTLLLPADQIIVRRYVLRRGHRDRAEAVARLAGETGHRPEELAIALSPAGERELVTVLAVPARTAAEALAYARRWGFEADRVSTRAEAERFGPHGPNFDPPETSGRRLLWRIPRPAAAAAAILVLGVGGWGAYGVLPSTESDPIVTASVPGEPRARLAADEHSSNQSASATAPETDAAIGDVQPLPAEVDSAGAPAAARVLLASYAPADDQAHAEPGPAEIPLPSGAVADEPPAPSAAPALLGPDLPAPAALPDAAAPAAPVNLALLDAGIERIRAERATDADVEIVLAAAGEFAPDSVPGRPLPRPGSTDAAAEAEHEEAEGSDLPDISEMSDSRLAVEQAPRPPLRPGSSRPPEQAIAHVAAAVAAPQVRDPAAERRLSLDAASLIGVFDARSGRQALLRLASGEYQRVATGDSVAGWHVSAIGQEAMRLTRGGESRTLSLITR